MYTTNGTMDPFSEYHFSKYRDDFLTWVKSLNCIHQTNNNNNNNKKKDNENDNNNEQNAKYVEQKKQKKVIEVLTTLQQHGICSIADFVHITNDKVNLLSLHLDQFNLCKDRIIIIYK